MTDSEFRGYLAQYGMGQLKYMFQLVRTKEMIRYYGTSKAKQYRQAIYDRMISRKVRGTEFEIWR